MDAVWIVRLVIAGSVALICIVAAIAIHVLGDEMGCINEDEPDWMEGEDT